MSAFQLSRRRDLVFLLTTLVACAPSLSQAQSDYPTKPIKVIVPFAAGGVTDIAARAFTDAMARELGQVFIVENRGGAGGMIGADAAAKSAPDGYTLLFTNVVTHGMLSTTSKHMSFRPLEDFAPIAMLSSYPVLLVVRPQLPAKNVADLIALAKRQPGKLTYSSAGPGSGAHFLGSQMEAMTGIDLVHVPYKGAAPALQDVMAGNVDFTFDGAARAAIESGRVRVIAVAGPHRDPRYPEVPTIEEAGYKGYGTETWQGFLAPAGTPAAIVARLNKAANNTLKNHAVLARLKEMGMVAVGSTPEQFRTQIQRDMERFRNIAAASRMSFE
jgi:tripartite-type tricarboxylate transporter receptor subunit TctC